MKTEIIKENGQIVKFIDSDYYNTDIFRITEVFSGVIWNIGRQNFPHPGYIPLCDTGYMGQKYWVNRNSLRALKVESEEFALFLLNKAHYKTINKKQFEKLHDEFFNN